MKSLKEVAAEFCKSQSTCKSCPERTSARSNALYSHCLINSLANTVEQPEDIISRLYHWLDNRPPRAKSRADVFFEMFPDASKTVKSALGTGRDMVIPSVCARHIFSNVDCHFDCIACWNSPAPQPKE